MVFTLTILTFIGVLGEVIGADWAIRAGGEGQDKIRGMVVAPDGSIFVTGEFGHPGGDFGSFQKESAGSLDFVIAKISADGEFLWVSTAGGPKIDRGYAVCLADDGGCYVTGHFESESILFGDVELKSAGDYDSFVAKYDAFGKCVWAKRQGGGGYDYGHGIAADTKGGCVVSGSFATTGTFGKSTFEHSKGRRAFLFRMSADGDMKWAREAGTADDAAAGTMSGHNLCTDRKGFIYMGGFQRGGAVFGKGVSIPAHKIQDIFVAKYSGDGKALWALDAGGESDGLATGLAPDEKGGCYITGMFKGTIRMVDADLTSSGLHDFYVAAINEDGKPKWVYSGGGEKTDYGLSIAADGTGGCLVTGEITEKATFRGKTSTSTKAAIGEKDSYILHYSRDGMLVSSNLFGGTDYDLSYAIGAGRDGEAFVAGAFRNETEIIGTKLTSKKGNDIFIARIAGK